MPFTKKVISGDGGSIGGDVVSGDAINKLNAEVIDARLGENGKSYASLGDRLDEVDSQLAHIENVIYPTDSTETIINKITSNCNVVSFSKGVYNLADCGEISINYPVTIKGNDSTLNLLNGSQLKINSKNVNLIDLNISVKNISNLKGGESCIKIYKSNVNINNCNFNGNKYYYGIFIGKDTEGDCNDICITNCNFDSLGYGILKNGGVDLQANRLKLEHLKFTNILHGDAIELNVGKDVGYYINDIYIENVISDGINNAGIGIGIAGGSYGGDKLLQSRNGVLKNCIIRNCEREAIHFEACNNFAIKDNIIENNNKSNGIAIYGCTDFNIFNNIIKNSSHGIKDDLGVVNSKFIISSDKNDIYSNKILNCATGIYLGCSGTEKYSIAENNKFYNCSKGIDIIGKCIININSNVFYDCDIPLNFDYENSSKASVFATRDRHIEIKNNTTIFNGNKRDNFSNICNIKNYDSIIFEDNNFKLGDFTRSPKIFYVNEPLYFVKGDIFYQDIDGELVQKVALTNGFRPGLTETSHYQAKAGDNYITLISGPDPRKKYKKGQMLNLKGLGDNGTDLQAMIVNISIVDSKYLIYIDKIISVNSTGTPTIVFTEKVEFNS